MSKQEFSIHRDLECEDCDRIYVDFPDGLRVIFEDGKYVGFYINSEEEA